MNNGINKRIRELIESNKISQKRFCETIGISVSTLNTNFQRDSNPGCEMLIRIANKFPKYSINWLLTGKGGKELEGAGYDVIQNDYITKLYDVHIGNVIKTKVEESDFSFSSFASQIGIQRQNIDRTIFEKKSIDTDMLLQISNVLNFDFFQYYSPAKKCNDLDDKQMNEVKGTLSIEFGKEKKDQVFRFVFGENNLEISNK